MKDLFERAHDWMAHDPDPATRAELEALVTRARTGEAAALKDLLQDEDREVREAVEKSLATLWE